MYGPAGVQVHAGHWQHDSLREANDWRRSHGDAEHLKEMEHADHAAAQRRLVAIAATVLVALTLIVLF